MKYIPAIISLFIALFGYVMYRRTKKLIANAAQTKRPTKLLSLAKNGGIAIVVIGLWTFVGCLITLVFGAPAQEEFTVNIISPRANLEVFGYRPSETMLVCWVITAALILAAIILRIFFVPRLTDIPGKFQNVLETLVSGVESYASERTIYLGRPMYGYVFAMGAFFIGNLLAELMGFRSPSSDLMFTLGLSAISFLMANWYGIRKLRVRGRLKNIMSPSPLLLPIRIVTDIANPISMACRLFGNTISGMIVMSLIYSVLGNFAIGLPSIVGLYFNVFTALIQMIIFITLTLSNINEATAE